MTRTMTATFDGTALHPDEPLKLAPHTRVRITVEIDSREEDTPASFLQTARSLQLEGPSDWSGRLDDYLYGSESETPK